MPAYIVSGGAEYKEEVRCPRCATWFSIISDEGIQVFSSGLCPACQTDEKIKPHSGCHWHERWKRLLELAWDAALSEKEALYTLKLMRVVQQEIPDLKGSTAAHFIRKLQDL